MRSLFAVLVSVLVIVIAPAARADQGGQADRPFLSPLFGDTMVLQRGIPVPVWGWAAPGTAVSVRMGSKTAHAVADGEGKWIAKLSPMAAGGPFELTVSGPQSVVLKNVLVGDVWVCSGQSNMEMGIGNVNNAAQEIASANYPQIRLFTVTKDVALEPRASLSGTWAECSPQAVASGGWNGFSAVGYFFGRALYEKLHVPIGLIHTSWGGTPAEAWTSADALQKMPDFADALAKVGQWRATVESGGAPPTSADGKRPAYDQNTSTVLYNGMIAPLIPYGIKGAIWYQGESNAGRAYQYRTLLPTMIGDWRSRWGEGSFPFYIVQLANFQDTKPEPGEDAWAELREAQLMTWQSVPHTGLAVIIDIGEAKDIHPKDKQDVGKRLALAALATTYGEKGEYSGPIYKAMKQEGGKIRLAFDHLGGGLEAHGGDKLQGFAIAGDDHHFVWADAAIEGGAVVVSSPQVPNPVAVRYGWAINPVCNLYNKAGLPASPFRTDSWPGVTVNNH